MKREEIDYTLTCEPELDPYVGNCSAIDDETDAEQEMWIREELERGNQWAWCMVAVTATFGDFEGEAHLSGCSYLSEEEFCQPGGTYEDMKTEALAVLEDRIEHAAGEAASFLGETVERVTVDLTLSAEDGPRVLIKCDPKHPPEIFVNGTQATWKNELGGVGQGVVWHGTCGRDLAGNLP